MSNWTGILSRPSPPPSRVSFSETSSSALVARLQPANVGHLHPEVAVGDIGIGQQVNAHALRQFEERFAQRLPADAVRVPVILPQVGADPDLRPTGLVGPDVVPRGLQHGGQVGRGARRFDRGELQQVRRRVDLVGDVGRALNQDPPPGAEHGERPRQLMPARLQFGNHRPRGLLPHARRPVEQNDSRVRFAAAGPAEPTAGQWPADGEDQRADRQRPKQQDQPLPQFRVPRATSGSPRAGRSSPPTGSSGTAAG